MDDVHDEAGDEAGTRNEILYCEACGIPVHVFCYGQASDSAWAA